MSCEEGTFGSYEATSPNRVPKKTSPKNDISVAYLSYNKAYFNKEQKYGLYCFCAGKD